MCRQLSMVAVALTFGTACKGDKSAAAVPTTESTATAKPESAVVAVEGAVAKRGSIWRPERAFLGDRAPRRRYLEAPSTRGGNSRARRADRRFAARRHEGHDHSQTEDARRHRLGA